MITFSVKNLTAQIGREGPLFVAGLLLLDETGAQLFDWDHEEQSVPVSDPDACAAVQAALPSPSEYFGDALMMAWVQRGPDCPELHSVYWVLLGNMNDESESRWGPQINVRPVPSQYDYVR